ncbi:hypothetical protein MTO96_016783 [Rhipicephalus appendiculatus]
MGRWCSGDTDMPIDQSSVTERGGVTLTGLRWGQVGPRRRAGRDPSTAGRGRRACRPAARTVRAGRPRL